MEKQVDMPAILEPASGFIVLGVVVLLILLVLRLVRAQAGKPKKGKGSPDNASAHTPADGSGGHHEKATGLKRVGQVLAQTLLLLWYLAIVLLVVYGIHWLHEDSKKLLQANSTYSVGRAAAAHASAMRGGSRAVSYDWQRITLPQGDATWTSWVEIPVGHSIRFCDPVSDPGCAATDFSNVHYNAQCRSLSDGYPRDQKSGDCAWTDAYRLRAKGSKPMPLLYRFERAS